MNIIVHSHFLFIHGIKQKIEKSVNFKFLMHFCNENYNYMFRYISILTNKMYKNYRLII